MWVANTIFSYIKSFNTHVCQIILVLIFVGLTFTCSIGLLSLYLSISCHDAVGNVSFTQVDLWRFYYSHLFCAKCQSFTLVNNLLR